MSGFSSQRGRLARIAPSVVLAVLASTGCGQAKGGAQTPPASEAATKPASEAATQTETAPAPAAAVEAPAELKNVLRWKTKWETLNKGFLVFRGDSEKGSFRQLTPAPIPGAASSNEPHEYSYEDTTIEAGREYFYYVIAINHNNEQVRVTPVQRAAPK